jgi:hypothetical protein
MATREELKARFLNAAKQPTPDMTSGSPFSVDKQTKGLMARLPSVIAGGKSSDLGTPVISPFSVAKPKPTSFTDAVEGNFKMGEPTGNALRFTPVADTPTSFTYASKPMGNITGVDKSVSPNPNPYRISADNEADVVGGDFNSGSSPTGNALKNTPVTDTPSASKPMGNASTAIQSKAVDEEKALKLFTKIHGKGGFDSRSSKDLAKMDAIKALMGQEGSDNMTPNQFAMKIYASQKRTK